MKIQFNTGKLITGDVGLGGARSRLVMITPDKKVFKNCIAYKYIFLITKSEITKNHYLYKYIIFPKIAKNIFLREYRNPLTTGTYSGYIYKVNKQMLFKDDNHTSSREFWIPVTASQ